MNWIIEKANQIYKRYGNEDLDFVVAKLKAKLFEIPIGEIVKEVYFKDLKVIAIDPDLHPYRKRHLIAHALGHHLFHQKRRANYFVVQDKNFLEGLRVKEHESEAEIFAAYFLIPEEKLSSVLKEEWVKDSPDPIPELTEEFQVSENFIRKRLEFKAMGLNS